MQAKFDEVPTTARATNKTVEELRAMMVQFMCRDKRLRHPGPSTTELANVTGTTKELTLSDSEHAILQTLAPSPEFQVVQRLDVPVSILPGDCDCHVPYDLDAAWASGTTKDRGGNDEAPTAAAMTPTGENKGTAGGQATDPIPTQEARGEEPHATNAAVPAAESLVEAERPLTRDSSGPLADEAGTKQDKATCNAVQPETQCFEERSEAVGQASSPVQKKSKKLLKSPLKVHVATTRGFTLMPRCSFFSLEIPSSCQQISFTMD